MKSFFFLFLSFVCIQLHSQITVSPNSLEKTISPDIVEYVYDVYVENPTEMDQQVWWKIKKENVTPVEWEFFVCDLNFCYTPNVTMCPASQPNLIPAKDTSKFTFHFLSNKVLGDARVWLEFYGDKTFTQFFDRTDSLGVITVGSPSSIADIEEKFMIYPNPVNDLLFIKDVEDQNKSVDILSTTGNKLMSFNSVPLEGISVQQLHVGLYFVSIKDRITNRLIIQKFYKL